MSRLRRFGRSQTTRADDPDPWLDDPPPAPASRPARSGDTPRPSLPRPPGRQVSGGSPFGRPPTTGDPGPVPAADVVPDPATRAARPAVWTPRRPEPDVDESLDTGPVTDPFGFPPVPPVVLPATGPPEPSSWAGWGPAPDAEAPGTESASSHGTNATAPRGEGAGWGAAIPVNGWAAWSAPGAEPTAAPAGNGRGPDVSSTVATAAPAGPETAAPAEPETAVPDTLPAPSTGPERVDDPPRADPHGPDPAEAAALAAAFAADYLSWDEDDPERRGRALAGYLPGPRTDLALLGWSGRGRQRTEMVLPGRVRPGGDDSVVVDLRVRVTPYRRVDQRGAARPETDPEGLLGEPAAAPPATARGWRGLASRWVRLGVSVALDGHDLVVDAGEQTLHDAPADGDPPSPLSLAARRRGAR